MANIAVIEKLIDVGSIARVLKKGTAANGEVKSLQEVLYYLGFGKALKWDKSGPDGDFGAATIKAVKAFAKANGVVSKGETVNTALGRILVQRYHFLDEMHHMQDAVNNASVLKQLRFKADAPIAIMALQTILNELGFGAEMNWEKFGADGEYGNGTKKAVQAFADKNGIVSDGMSVTPQMAKISLKSFTGFYGPDWYKESPKVVMESLSITRTNKGVQVSDGAHKKEFRKFKLGYYTFGSVSTGKFIEANRPALKKMGMTDSALNVMLGVSENEGNIDAINTWDNAIMTFGLFQWTVGVGDAKGELPALFKKIKDEDPGVWHEYYGRHGLDVWNKTSDTHGHLVLHGQILNKKQEKQQLRDPKWCFYFWKAGQDEVVQSVSVKHAFSRIGTFARSSSYQINGHDVADVITSEYAWALVVDNHVNRPGYIKGVLTKAMDQVGLKGTDPKKWKTADERKLVDRYITLRETYGKSPMTDAAKRAKVTKRYLTKGIISAERGSFKFK
ncbi:MAG: peptidoglycan-binding protein [Pseudomonadota bacterium]